MTRVAFVVTALLLALLASTTGAHAQSGTAASIAGTVRDTSGAVLPGVTVEAASPVLIEKVRTVVSDERGNYKIVDLRPGVYTVTFTLPGFRTVKRQDLELITGVTAQASADLQVGALEETVTVTGASPVVDVQNVQQQSVFKRSVQEALPIGRNIAQWAAVIPAATLSASGATGTQDVGGTGPKATYVGFHGVSPNLMGMLQDGMLVKPAEPSAFGLLINPAAMEEVQIEYANAGAEVSSGTTQMNVVPREGGNQFKASSMGNYTGKGLQSSNITSELKSRGLAQLGDLKILRVINFGVGGPIAKDRLWFYTAHQWSATRRNTPGSYFNARQDSLFYAPDLTRPAFNEETDYDNQVRLTWQVTQKHKITFHQFHAGNCNCYFGLATSAPESAARILQSEEVSQGAWRYPATNRLLWEVGVTKVKFHSNKVPQAGVTPDMIAVTELSRGLQYHAYITNFTLTGSYGNDASNQVNEHVTMTYVTGSHAWKTGLSMRQDWRADEAFVNGDISYAFLNGVPQSLTLWASPSLSRDYARDFGVFVQDQWKLKNWTFNLGIRYDAFRGYQNDQQLPAGRYVPARNYLAQNDIPNWKDITPRGGVAYDVFGNGKTAVKASINRYVDPVYAGGTTAQFNPVATTVVSANRTWTDANGNLAPDCVLGNSAANGECGPLSDANFGKPVPSTRFADDVRYGWGARPYTWQGMASMQQELWPGAAITVGYFRTWFGNFNTAQNVLVNTSADFDQYCVTLPVDSRVPGGGTSLCGLYDIKPAKFGQVSNLVTMTSNFGKQTQVFNGIDATVNMQLAKGAVVTGGVATGATVRDSCDVKVNSPQNLFCHVSPPWSAGTQFKMAVVYPLPLNFRVSATYQNLAGVPITASYVATNAAIAPSLGRNLASCGTRVPCTATVTIPNIFDPVSKFENRLTQVDVRLTKILKIGAVRAQGNVDLYNVFNANTVLATNNRFGASWLTPNSILGGRLLKFGFQLDL